MVREVSRIKRPVAICGEIVETEMLAWCSNLRNTMLRAINVGLRTGSEYNTSRLYVWALKQLHVSEWALMRNDKDSGWFMMPKTTLRHLTQQVLDGGNYSAARVPDVNVIMQRGMNLARRIARLESDERWTNAVSKGWRSSALVCRLQLLLKSHKEEGAVSCRAEHVAPRFSLAVLSRWLMQKIRSVTENLTHLITSSQQVVSRIERMHWTAASW